MLLLEPKQIVDSPLLRPIAAIAAVYSLLLFACGIVSTLRLMPFGVGAALLGSGLEVMGPAPYFLFALCFGIAVWGVQQRWNWARRSLIALSAISAFLLVPVISSAVVDQRWGWLTLLWIDILPRIVIATVLWREREAFDG